MDEAKLKRIVAKNITAYRKEVGLTQGALAEKLNYSDKSVSKWERGDGIPDLLTLCNLAEIFGVTVNDLLTDGKVKTLRRKASSKRIIIPLLSVGLVWLVAALGYFALEVIPVDFEKGWLIFVCAVPVSFIVLTVFNCLWRGMVWRGVSVSGIIWGMFITLRCSVPTDKINLLLIPCAIFQLLTVLWFYMRHRSEVHKMQEITEHTSTES